MARWRDHAHFAHLQRLSVEPFLRDIPEGGAAEELIGAIEGLSKAVRDAERLRPLNRRSTLRIAYSRGARTTIGAAFDALAVGYAYAWGGGM